MKKHKNIQKILLATAVFASVAQPVVALSAPWDADNMYIDPCESINSSGEDSKNTDWRKEVMSKAKEGIEGAKYSQDVRWEWQKSMDCSSFVALCYEKALNIDRKDFGQNTMEQEKKLKKIDRDSAKEGDLIFYYRNGKDKPSDHVAIYDGNGGIYEMSDPEYNGQQRSLDFNGHDKDVEFFTIEGTDFGDEAISKYADAHKKTKSDSSSKSDGSQVSESKMETVKRIYDFLHGQFGLSAQAVAGIAGNWEAESKIEPQTVQGIYRKATDDEFSNALGKMGIGVGLGQWTDARNIQLEKYADKKGDRMKAKEIETQLAFMIEGDTDAPTVKKYALKASDSPSENALMFHSMWERSADDPSMAARRGKYAEEIYDKMQDAGMTGGKDESKINKISGSGNADISAISSSTGGEETNGECSVSDAGDGKADFGGGWQSPVKDYKGGFSSDQDFGECSSFRKNSWHNGLDFGSTGFSSDKNIYAVHNGKIVEVTYKGAGIGQWVAQDVGGQQVYYQEFTDNADDIFVKKGQEVKAGDKIGRLSPKGGMSGVGTHLHLTITKKGATAEEVFNGHAFSNDGFSLDPKEVLGL